MDMTGCDLAVRRMPCILVVAVERQENYLKWVGQRSEQIQFPLTNLFAPLLLITTIIGCLRVKADRKQTSRKLGYKNCSLKQKSGGTILCHCLRQIAGLPGPLGRDGVCHEGSRQWSCVPWVD